MTQIDELIERAQSALDAGDRLVARGYWRRATRIAPDRLDLWLDLLQVTEMPAERKRCLEHILQLDPANDEARAELKRMRQLESPEASPTLPAEASIEKEVGPAGGAGTTARAGTADQMRLQWDAKVAAGEPLVCVNHPQRETTLRCNHCGAPICVKCAVHTPVGFRCPACIKEQQAIFYTARWYDYPLAALVSLMLSTPAAILAGMAGWWFALIISPLAGGLIGGLVHWVVGRRRGRWIWLIVGICMALGALVALVAVPRSILAIGMYGVMATGSAVGVLRLGKSR
jgi:hypothetical protein